MAWHDLLVKALRYLAYLGFAVGALVFWSLFYVLLLGFFPFPAEPACHFEPGGCSPPIWKQLGTVIVILGTIPATTLGFSFFRRWVRARVGLGGQVVAVV